VWSGTSAELIASRELRTIFGGLRGGRSVIASQRVGAKAPPDDRLREAIQLYQAKLDFFVIPG